MTTKERKPRFEVGDIVGFWASRENGTVKRVWFDGAHEMVRVEWSNGSVTDERAYKLAFAH
jgi:hypothetical protein